MKSALAVTVTLFFEMGEIANPDQQRGCNNFSNLYAGNQLMAVGGLPHCPFTFAINR